MPSRLRLALVFLASLLIFSVYLFPASLILSRLDGVRVAGSPLQLNAVSGRIWAGQVQWQWRQLSGTGQWQSDWRGLMPGLKLDIRGAFGLSGWIGGNGSTLMLQDAELSLPGATLSQIEPRLRLGGQVRARQLGFDFRDKAVTDASGMLSYTGGPASWANQNSVEVPALSGVVTPTQQGATLDVSSLAGQRMALGAINGNVAELKVLRAWAAEIGMSRGGALDDVIFETSLPLWQSE